MGEMREGRRGRDLCKRKRGPSWAWVGWGGIWGLLGRSAGGRCGMRVLRIGGIKMGARSEAGKVVVLEIVIFSQRPLRRPNHYGGRALASGVRFGLRKTISAAGMR